MISITINNIMSMIQPTQLDQPMARLSVTLPVYLYQRLKAAVPKGEVSQFVTASIETSLVAHQLDQASTPNRSTPVDQLFAFSQKLPSTPYDQIKRAINRGRH